MNNSNFNINTGDKLEYVVYFNNDSNSGESSKLKLQKEIQIYINELLGFLTEINYIWFNEKFSLKPSSKQNTLFSGKFNFGDNILEEWLIVWTLNKLSLKFHDLIITLGDCDGEFLLIEFSNELEESYTPELCENKVFLKAGKLCLLKESSPKFPKLPQTSENFAGLELPSSVQASFNEKLNSIPDQIKDNLHITRLSLPQNLAHLLTVKPQLISSIANAYYLRDPSLIKQITLNSVKDQIKKDISVKFNKFGYAKVKYQSFGLIPKSILNRFGMNEGDEKEELGVKLILGLELLLIELRSNASSNFDIETYNFIADINWERYYNSELETNYFKGFDESSEEYNTLLNELKLKYLEGLNNSEDSEIIDKSVNLKEIESILNEKLNDNTQFDSSIDQNEEWMTVGINELDNLFNNRNFTNPETNEELNLDEPDILKLDTIQSNLNTYLNIESDFEGIENMNNLDLDLDLNSEDYFDKLEFYLNDLTSFDPKEDAEDLALTKELQDQLTNVDLNQLNDNTLEHLLTSVIEEQDQLGPSSILLKQLLDKE